MKPKAKSPTGQTSPSKKSPPENPRAFKSIFRKHWLKGAAILLISIACVAGAFLWLNREQPEVITPLRPPSNQKRLPGQPNLSKGVNVTLWFRFPQEETAQYYKDYINETDLQLIHQLGFNHVRLSVAPDFIFDQHSASLINSSHLQYLDAAINKIINNDLSVIVDLHDESKQFESKSGGQKLVKFWGNLSKHLAPLPSSKVAFEPLNEPQFENKHQDWLDLQRQVISEIRKQAPTHTIIATGADWGSLEGLKEVIPLADKNIIYSFHFYEPSAFTHQGADWGSPEYTEVSGLQYPYDKQNCDQVLGKVSSQAAIDLVADYCDRGWDKAAIEQTLKGATEWRDKNHVNLYVGELGVYCKQTPRQSKLQWFQDVSQAFTQAGLDWSLWGYDDCFGLDAHKNGTQINYDQEVLKAIGL